MGVMSRRVELAADPREVALRTSAFSQPPCDLEAASVKLAREIEERSQADGAWICSRCPGGLKADRVRQAVRVEADGKHLLLAIGYRLSH